VPAVVQVQYTALPHYEDKFEDFKADTIVLRRRFTPEGKQERAKTLEARRRCCSQRTQVVLLGGLMVASSNGMLTWSDMCPAGDDTLVREGDKLPADSLVLSTKNIWSIIRSQKDLNLPAHKVGRQTTAC
jgi:hypothetical protein